LIASHMMAIYVFKIPAEWYGYNTWINTNIGDLLIGVIKAVFFGAVIVFVASEQGLNSKRGSIAVGEAIKASVVLSSIWIVVTNLFLSLALNQIFPLDLRAY